MIAARGSLGASTGSPATERWISLGEGAAKLPERLLLAHSRGEVLFITGAGTSKPSGLPDFRDLVVKVYAALDPVVCEQMILSNDDRKAVGGLTFQQQAELGRFDSGDYDVVLGMLERRLDGDATLAGKVRQTVCTQLRYVLDRSGTLVPPAPSGLHKTLMRLSERDSAVTVATTNFDCLLERASPKRVPTYSLGGIPRPSRRPDFAGVMHIHGVIDADPKKHSDVIVTDRDFGEFYLRRRVVPDFIYDAARLYHLVLVGYSASDAPMRYLLNAVAADGSRFRDLKERFAFVAGPKEPCGKMVEDWKGRGITPIPYDEANHHQALRDTLDLWADLSTFNGRPKHVDRHVRRIVKRTRQDASDDDRDLFDHLYRRSSATERLRLTSLASTAKASMDWLDAMNTIALEERIEDVS